MMNRNVEVAVIILTCDQKEVTLRCLSSFEKVDHTTVGILVWDNGSSDDTAAAIEERFPQVEVRYSPSNLGAAGGRNAGANTAIELWGPDYLLFLDNDTVVTSGLISNLRSSFNVNSGIGVTTPKIRLLKDPERIDSAGGCLVQYHLGQTPVVGSRELDRGQYDVSRDCVPGGIIMVRTEIFRLVEGFDTGYDPYGLEDIDFSLRIKDAGYRCIYVPEAVVYHSPSQTFEGGQYSANYTRQKAKNWHRFVQRHASPLEKIAFWFIGVPLRFIGAVAREVRRGNLQSIKGFASGAHDILFGDSRGQ